MKRIKILSLIILLGIVLPVFSCSQKSVNPLGNDDETGIIDADNSRIHYGGRFDRNDPKRAVFDWPGVYIRAQFEGTSCSIRLKDGSNFYAVTLDNQPPKVLATDTSTVYNIATDLADTVHTILIEKRTESFVGKGQFLGFILDDDKGLIKQNSTPDRRIEFIGNSITCGYGVEGESASSPFLNQTENATLSYAALVGRALDADYALIAYSGRGVVRNYGDVNPTSEEPMPSLYNRTICSDSLPLWDFSSWIPQVVVINLGTNDFSTQPHPDKAVFQEGYKQLINRIQSQYPDVTIFCVSGPMIGEPCTEYVEEVVTQYQLKSENKEVYFIEVETAILTLENRGSDWHPNITGQQETANVVLPVIKERMGW